jgi:hypothetical protein
LWSLYTTKSSSLSPRRYIEQPSGPPARARRRDLHSPHGRDEARSHRSAAERKDRAPRRLARCAYATSGPSPPWMCLQQGREDTTSLSWISARMCRVRGVVVVAHVDAVGQVHVASEVVSQLLSAASASTTGHRWRRGRELVGLEADGSSGDGLLEEASEPEMAADGVSLAPDLASTAARPRHRAAHRIGGIHKARRRKITRPITATRTTGRSPARSAHRAPRGRRGGGSVSRAAAARFWGGERRRVSAGVAAR